MFGNPSQLILLGRWQGGREGREQHLALHDQTRLAPSDTIRLHFSSITDQRDEVLCNTYYYSLSELPAQDILYLYQATQYREELKVHKLLSLAVNYMIRQR